MAASYLRKWTHKRGIIRQRGCSYQVEINTNGQRHRAKAASLEKAKELIDQKLIEIRNEGVAALSLSAAQRADAAKALLHLPEGMTLESSAKHYAAAVSALEGASLDDAVGFYMRHHRPAGGVRTVVELLGEYVTAKRKSMRRERTIKDIRSRMGRFAETFGNHHVHMITPADIERWLDDAGYAAQNRLNYLRILSGFFNYARRQGLIEMNPADREHVERPQVDERLPEIFTMGQVEKLLTTAVSDCPKMVPYLSIAFFAGLRSAELDGLGWDSIDLDERLITVRPEVAKKRRQRHVEISNNLAAWLAPYRKMDGRLRPLAARKYLDRIVGAAGVKWVRNGMRHTFASNHLAKHQDMSKTALQLGHVGRLDILFNHYRNLVKPAEAEAYWRIVPPQEVGAVVESTKTV